MRDIKREGNKIVSDVHRSKVHFRWYVHENEFSPVCILSTARLNRENLNYINHIGV